MPKEFNRTQKKCTKCKDRFLFQDEKDKLVCVCEFG
jgi:hypothetical protein